MKNQSMSLKGLRNAHFSSVIGKRGLFRDGDWVESKDQDPTGDVRLVQLADIGEGVYLNKSARFLTSSKAKELRCTFLHPGDLLVARMPDPIGRACVFPGDPKPCVTAVDVCIVRPDPELVDVQWLKWATNSPEFRSHLGRFTAGTTRKRISRKNLEQVPLTIPPLPEQRRIAAILDKADAIRRKRQETIRLMEEFRLSVFLDMFGNIGSFEHVKIQDIASKKKHALSSGPFGSNLTSAHYTNEGVIVLRGLNISDGRLNLDDVKFVSEEKAQSLVRSEVGPGDILVVAVGSSGLACQIPNSLPRSIMSQNFNKISPDVNKTNPTYLEYCINSLFVQRQLKQEITDTVRTFLSLTKLKNVEIPLPPLRDQEKFAQVVRKSEQLRTKQRRAERKSDDIFNSLVHRAFRGELKSTEAELVKNRENRGGRTKFFTC